ncbi:MAG TPA: TIGR01777 family oxidoreductase [Solirubrobacteraceae bacterium]|nr:TIGR01777 family oxidoreductase [Solirubrobacteraceae bacterium]
MSAPRVTVTGATGLIGPALVAALLDRGAQVTALTRDPPRARAKLGDVEAVRWEPLSEPAPVEALAGRDAVVHLAGEPVAQRWSEKARRAIRDSRVTGTRNVIAGLARAEPRPRALISSSAIGYYGAHGEEPLDEEAPAGRDFLAQVCAAWEAEALKAAELGMRVVPVRTGVVLDARGGALAKMLPPFRLGLGGPVAGGRQYISWIHAEDLVGLMLAALEDDRWSGPINATAPEPVSNRDFSRALGAALGRPSLLPVPGLALRLLYGEMAEIVTTGARAVPAKPLVLGYRFRHPQLREALAAALRPAPPRAGAARTDGCRSR